MGFVLKLTALLVAGVLGFRSLGVEVTFVE